MDKSRRHCITVYKGVVVLSTLLYSFSSCQEETYQYPSVKTDFVSVTTDSEGKVDSLYDDDGNKYALSLEQDKLTKDSLYRCVGTYALDESGIHLYGLQHIVSPNPVKYASLKTDVVTSLRIWRGAGYINMVVKSLGQSKSHKWGLNEDYISVKNGRKQLHFTLYHDMNGDYPAFSRDTYLSFPLRKYTSQMISGDSIFVSVHQKQGKRDTVIVYPLTF